MTPPIPATTKRSRRATRWLAIAAAVVLVGVLIVLLAHLLRRLGPQTEVWLHIAPAASTIDDARAVVLSSGGWRSNEQVAICVNHPDDGSCEAELAVLVENADAGGTLNASVPAGALLAEGRTVFLVRGFESGAQASRSFRVLRAAEGSLASAPDTTGIELGELNGSAPLTNDAPSADPPLAPDPALELFPDWRGEYFDNPELTGQPALVRNDPDLNLNWGEGSPAPGVIPADGFSVRWTRNLDFAPGVYRFVLTAEDGARLLIEDQLVIDAWQGMAGQTLTADQALTGGPYQVVVHFRDLGGVARVAVGWSPLPTPTPVQVAGVDPTATPTVLPAPEATETLSIPETATPTEEPRASATDTPVSGAGTPAATESASPTSSITANATETAVTPTGEPPSGTPTATPTATPTPQTAGTPMMTPASGYRFIEINPTVGQPGQQITVNSGNWNSATVLRVSLGEFNTPYTVAVPLAGVTYTTPIDSSQPWSFRFTFPNEPPWSTQNRPVVVWVHSADWTQWGRDEFDFDTP